MLDSVAATELYSSGVCPNPDGDDTVWSDYNASHFPFHEDAHWPLGVADLSIHTLYYMDPDTDETWSAKGFPRDWLSATGAGRRWRQVIRPAPQQRKGSSDCGIADMVFMLHVARGDGMATQPPPKVQALALRPPIHPSS